MTEALSYLKKLLSIQSPSGNEFEVLKYLKSELKKLNFEVKFSPVPNKAPNLIAKRGSPIFAISTHVDHVILKNNSDYEITDDFVIGPGVADTKAQIASLLAALKDSSLDAAVILTVDEEKEGSGSRSLNLQDEFKGILVLEPTDFVICRFQAGAIELKLSTLQESYHASCAKTETNPIIMSSDLLARIKDLRSKSVFLQKWGLPAVTPVFLFAGDEEVFASPGELKMQLDLPVAPEENPTEVFSKITKIVKDSGFQIDWAEIEPGFAFPASSSILKTVEEAYTRTFKKAPEYGIMPSWTDAANFALAGVDVVVFGAGTLAYCHTPKEYIRLSDLEKLTLFIKNFLQLSNNNSELKV